MIGRYLHWFMIYLTTKAQGAADMEQVAIMDNRMRSVAIDASDLDRKHRVFVNEQPTCRARLDAINHQPVSNRKLEPERLRSTGIFFRDHFTPEIQGNPSLFLCSSWPGLGWIWLNLAKFGRGSADIARHCEEP